MSADVGKKENIDYRNYDDNKQHQHNQYHYNGYATYKHSGDIDTSNHIDSENRTHVNSKPANNKSLDYQQQIDLYKKYTEMTRPQSQHIDQSELNNRLSLIVTDSGSKAIRDALANQANIRNQVSQSATNLNKKHQSLFSLSKNKNGKAGGADNSTKNSTELRHFSNSPAKTNSATASPAKSSVKEKAPKSRAKSNSFIKRLSFRFKSHSTEATDLSPTGDEAKVAFNKSSTNKNNSKQALPSNAAQPTNRTNKSTIELDRSYPPTTRYETTTKFTANTSTSSARPNVKASSQILYSEYDDYNNRNDNSFWNNQVNSNQYLNDRNNNFNVRNNNSNNNFESADTNFLNIDTMRKVFNVFDRDHDGSITIEDVQEVMNSLSYLKNEIEMPSIEQVKVAFEKFDENKNGSIEFNEFSNILKSAANQNLTETPAPMQSTYSSSVNNLETTNRQISNISYDEDTMMKRVKADSSLLGNEYSLSNNNNNLSSSNISNNNTYSINSNRNSNGNDDKSKQNEIYDMNQFNNDFSDLVRANMKLIFEQFDKDNDGKITRNELNFVMCNLFPDETITSQDIDEMLHAADMDNNGFIDFEEFSNMFNLYKNNTAYSNIDKIDNQTSPYYRKSLANIHFNPPTQQQPTSYYQAPASERLTRKELNKLNKSSTSKSSSRSNSKDGTSKQAKLNTSVQSINNSPQANNYRKVVQIFTSSQIMDLKAAFTMFDKNGDQKISETELLQVMEYLGLKTTEKEVKAMIQVVDKNRNGYVDYDEFIQMMTQTHIKPLSAEEELKKTFDIFDIDRNGFICADEIKKTMQNLGENLTDEEVRDMIRAADKNGDGKIDLNEFSGLLSGASIFQSK